MGLRVGLPERQAVFTQGQECDEVSSGRPKTALRVTRWTVCERVRGNRTKRLIRRNNERLEERESIGGVEV